MSKVYADGSSEQKTYDAFNRLATITDARGVVKTHTYDVARGLLLSESYSDETNNRTYLYNFLAMPVQISDDAGVRNFAYNSFNELETDSLVADSVTHLVTELRDDYGRSVGYTYAKNNSVQQTTSVGYGTDGRISTAGFVHAGAVKQFNYAYLNDTNLLQTLTMPNNMSLTQGFEDKRDLLTQMAYKRGNTLVSQRVYTYDALGRPQTRQTLRNGQTVNDSFVHTYRSELASAQVNGQTCAYDYDNIGNRRMSIDASDYAFYDANELNQYSSIRKNEESAFVPTFDAAGNQTLVRTATGTWSVTYNAENRPVIFQKTTDSVTTRITCTYDYMGRRATKKVEEITTDAEGNETTTVISNHRFIYRGYLQIACCDLSRANHPCLWLITWDPTQPVATRPLAIQKDGTWYTYGWDLTKNICEIFGQNGYIRNTYAYTPFGAVSASGDVEQPIQWSSEYYDNELALVYYNYRHYNPTDGRWINRDPITEQGGWNLYVFVGNKLKAHDVLGLVAPGYEEAQAIVLLNKINSTTNTPQNDKLYYKSEELWGWGHWGKITLHSKNDFTPNLHMKTNCIKYLSVAGHGNYEEKYKTASVQWGIDILYEGPTERKCDTQISSMFIGIKFCSSCTVEILSCYIGKSIYLKERLKRITGCKIITYDGPTM